MVPKDKPEKTVQSSPPNIISGLIEKGKENIETIITAQNESFEKCQEMGREWVARLQSEADMAFEFSTELTSAHSLPELATACQDWATRRMAMVVEDGRRIVVYSQQFAQCGARLLSNGWRWR